MKPSEQFHEIEQFLADRSIRLTLQRQHVVQRMVKREHFTAEEMVKDVQQTHPSIARGTVYRTLALLQENGLLEKHDFRQGAPHYELTHGRQHHDHLMCLQCGEIIEFHDDKLEAVQDRIIEEYGYQLVSHSHKLYGLCGVCQKKGKKTKKANAKPPKLRVMQSVE